MLQTYIPDCVFVDIFSGSGGIGIEALSRGARKAYFIENAPKALACIEDNLAFTKMKDRAIVLKQDACAGLTGIYEKHVDVIFMDPPYDQEQERRVLEQLRYAINNDPEVSPYMKLVMVENYNVSYAEKLIPACDISEQISLASKEASGTGNMKFMLNGAVTLGTSDGANVEIHELVGDDNIYIFGKDSDTVIKHYEKADYVSKDYYKKSPVIKEAVDFIVSKEVLKVGKKENLERLYNELLNKDWFMTLLDLEDYIKVKDQAFADYEDQQKWKKMMLVNIAKAGFFSSDRTIAEYNRDIWKLK